MSGGAVNCFKFGETMEPVSSPNGISFIPDHDIDNMPEISTLVIPGAISVGEIINNKEVVEKLRTIVDQVDTVMTICTGAFILQAIGALEGRTSTTYWRV